MWRNLESKLVGLLGVILLILLALLITRTGSAPVSTQAELKWLRRKVDTMSLQIHYILINVGALDIPSLKVRQFLEDGKEMQAIGQLREETGLTVKEAGDLVEKFRKNMQASRAPELPKIYP